MKVPDTTDGTGPRCTHRRHPGRARRWTSDWDPTARPADPGRRHARGASPCRAWRTRPSSTSTCWATGTTSRRTAPAREMDNRPLTPHLRNRRHPGGRRHRRQLAQRRALRQLTRTRSAQRLAPTMTSLPCGPDAPVWRGSRRPNGSISTRPRGCGGAGARAGEPRRVAQPDRTTQPPAGRVACAVGAARSRSACPASTSPAPATGTTAG